MHYIMFTGGESNELFDIMFSDLKKDARVSMESGVPQHDHKLLYRLHHARSLNRHAPAPFRFVWESSRMEALLRKKYEEHGQLCLIFNNFSLPFFEPSQIKAWQRRYGVKLVLCFIDRLSSYFAAEARMYADNIKFDAVYSYYAKDARDAGMDYFDCYYSKQELPGGSAAGGHATVYFWGSDTGRRATVEEIYRHLCSLGISSKMGICYARGDEPRLDGIVYDSPRDYAQILKDIASSDVLLDIIAGEGGVSLRYYEAVVYGKKLISNNPEIKNMRYYDPQSMLLIKKAQDIDPGFFKKDIGAKPYDGGFSPVCWVNELDARFS